MASVTSSVKNTVTVLYYRNSRGTKLRLQISTAAQLDGRCVV